MKNILFTSKQALIWLLCIVSFGASTALLKAQNINLTEIGAIYEQNFNAGTSFSEINFSVTNLNPLATDPSNSGVWTIGNVPFGASSNNSIARGGTGNAAIYAWSQTLPGNDWMITPGFELAAGKPYRFGYWYRNSGTNFPERMKVYLSTSNVPADVEANVPGTEQIKDYPSIQTAIYLFDEITFTPTEDGVYYLAFHATSNADQFFIAIDDIVAENLEPLTNDVAVTAISPNINQVNCSEFTATTGFTITVSNLGVNNQTNFDVNWTVSREGTPIANGTETIASLNAESDTDFEITIDASIPGTYTITATTDLATDVRTGNDALTLNILNPRVTLANEADSYEQDFEGTSALNAIGWSTEGIADAEQTWSIFSSTAFAASGDNFAVCFRSGVAANSWLYSNCLDLVAGQTYRVSFLRRANGGLAETLELHLGNAPNSASMTLLESYSFSENNYIEEVQDFTVPTSGIYHLAWRMTSAAGDEGSNGVLLEDVSIIAIPSKDVGISNVVIDVNTADCANFTDATPFIATITNFGSEGQTNFDVSIEVVGENVGTVLSTTQTVATLDSGADTELNFTADLSVPDTYTVNIITLLENDAVAENDELEALIANPLEDLTADNAEYTQNFDDVFFGWQVINTANNNTWGLGNNPVLANSGSGYFFCLTNTTAANNDWLISNCLDLEANKVYTFSFSYLTNESAERLSVALGNQGTVAAMTRTLFSSTNLVSAQDYTEVTVDFAVQTAGTYYIGFHNTTAARATGTPGATRIDDFNLLNTGAAISLPSAPTNLTLSIPNPLQRALQLNWNVANNATSYTVERSLNGVDFTVIATGVANTNYTDADINFDINYHYRVKAVNVLGESAYSNVESLSITALENNALSGEISIFPNPTADKIKLNMSAGIELISVEILDNNGLGSELKNKENILTNDFEINLKDKPTGLYFLKVKTNKGTVLKKIIKE